MPLSKHFRFCLWWESFFNGGHFSTCQTRKKSTPVTFFLHMRHVFLRPGVISLRRKMTPRSIFDGGRYSSLHRLVRNPITVVFRQKGVYRDFHRLHLCVVFLDYMWFQVSGPVVSCLSLEAEGADHFQYRVRFWRCMLFQTSHWLIYLVAWPSIHRQVTLVRHPVSKMLTFMKNRVESGYNYSALLVYEAIIDFGTICIGASHGRALSHHSFFCWFM